MRSSNRQPVLRPGWYQTPSKANTLQYWDGDDWTGDVVPVQPNTSPGVLQIAQGVALGVTAGGVVLRFLFG